MLRSAVLLRGHFVRLVTYIKQHWLHNAICDGVTLQCYITCLYPSLDCTFAYIDAFTLANKTLANKRGE